MIGTRSLILAIAALAACTGLATAQGPPEGFGQGPPPDFGGEGMQARGGRFDRAERIARVLRLKDDQKAQVKTILQNSTEQSQGLQQQLMENRQAIAKLIQSGAADFDEELQKLANTRASLTSQLTVVQAKGLAQVWNLLTPEQKKKAEERPELFSPGMGGGPMGGRSTRFGGPPPEM